MKMINVLVPMLGQTIQVFEGEKYIEVAYWIPPRWINAKEMPGPESDPLMNTKKLVITLNDGGVYIAE